MKRFHLALIAPRQTNSLHIHCHCENWWAMSVIGPGDWRKARWGEKCGLIWIGHDSWELSISAVSVVGKVVDLCFSWQEHSVCQVYRSATETHTSISGRARRRAASRGAGGHTGTQFCWKWRLTHFAKTGLKMFLFRCLSGKRLAWLNPKTIVLQQL